MKRICVTALLLTSLILLCGCEQLMDQVETVTQQIDVESLVTDAIENIDWEQLEQNAKQGYNTLTEQFPALKSENIKGFLKTNGLELLKSYVEKSDADMQHNARKLGQILKILSPELTDEVDSVIAE